MFVLSKGPGKYFAKCGDGPTCWVPDPSRANTFDTIAEVDYCRYKYGGNVIEFAEL